MARKRRRGLSYLPDRPTRTPIVVYLLVAAVCLGGVFYFKGSVAKNVSGQVVDAYTGQPVVGASIVVQNDPQLARTADLPITTTLTSDIDGSFRYDKATEKLTLAASENNYQAASVSPSTLTSITVQLRPKMLRGIVRGLSGDASDSTGTPVSRALVSLGDKSVLTNAGGEFAFENPPEKGQLLVKAPAFKPGVVDFDRVSQKDIALEPFVAKGLYLTAKAAADPGLLPNIVNLVKDTELNTVVIDLKDSNGLVSYDSKVPLTKAASPDKGKLTNPAALIKSLHDQGIYAVARFAVFQDATLTDIKPGLALKSKSTGKAWADPARFNWADPYNKEVWDYNIALAKEAAGFGFDEVQLSYVQFPIGKTADIAYSQPDTEDNRNKAILDFLKQADTDLRQLGTFVSVEVLGATALESGDVGIGQDISKMAEVVDYISPVLFPGYFGKGSFNFDKPSEQPYEVVKRSSTFARTKIQGKRAQLRPWLQDFSAEGVTYDAPKVRAEIQAVEDVNKDAKSRGGWLLWNTEAKYTAPALLKER